jgi:signal transduction histidine kinase
MNVSEDNSTKPSPDFNAEAMIWLVAGAAAVGALALAGWLTGTRFLTSVRDTYFPMPPSTAIAILLTSLSMVLIVFWPTNLWRKMAAVAINIGLMAFSFLILLTFTFVADPRIEERLFGIQGELNGIPIGRMSPLASVMFFIMNLALLTFSFGRARKSVLSGIAVFLGTVVLITGSITTLGYFYGTPLLYGGSTRPIAPTAGFAFALLGAALIAGAGRDVLPLKFFVGRGVQAQMLRSILPIIIFLIVAGGWLDAVIPSRFDINPVYVSAFSAIIFLIMATFLIARASQTIGGTVDRANKRREKAEAQLHKTVAELARSNTELEQFAYVASHDLQEPLRMISSYLQLLENRYSGKLDQDATEFIEYAVDGALRMQVLINDLLSLSRVGTKGKPFEPVSLEEVMTEAKSNLMIAIEESGAEITHDPLPELSADSSQMVQLFQNLLGNAIKFRGHEEPRVHVSAQKRDGEWEFAVTDNGIGFEPQYKDRRFVIFKRLHGRGEYSGTGMGLAVSKKIVERHGGRIWAESEPGRGSVFHFTLPVKPSHPENQSELARDQIE